MNNVQINTLKQYEGIMESIQGIKNTEPFILWMPPINTADQILKEIEMGEL